MKIGQIVISTFGHDMGEWYVVKEVEKNYVHLMDGKNKPIEKPKKKKIKHVLQTEMFAGDIALKIATGQYLQNAEVRKTLKFFKKQF